MNDAIEITDRELTADELAALLAQRPEGETSEGEAAQSETPEV